MNLRLLRGKGSFSWHCRQSPGRSGSSMEIIPRWMPPWTRAQRDHRSATPGSRHGEACLSGSGRFVRASDIGTFSLKWCIYRVNCPGTGLAVGTGFRHGYLYCWHVHWDRPFGTQSDLSHAEWICPVASRCLQHDISLWQAGGFSESPRESTEAPPSTSPDPSQHTIHKGGQMFKSTAVLWSLNSCPLYGISNYIE